MFIAHPSPRVYPTSGVSFFPRDPWSQLEAWTQDLKERTAWIPLNFALVNTAWPKARRDIAKSQAIFETLRKENPGVADQ